MFRLKPSHAIIALTTIGAFTPWVIFLVKWIIWRITVWPIRVESYEENHEKWLADPFKIGEPPVFPQNPFTTLEFDIVNFAWVFWSTPFILLSLLAWFLLRKKKEMKLTYKKIYTVIGCSAMTGWIAMIISFNNAWLGYHGSLPSEVLLIQAALYHWIYTLVGLIIGLILSQMFNAKESDG